MGILLVREKELMKQEMEMRRDRKKKKECRSYREMTGKVKKGGMKRGRQEERRGKKEVGEGGV